jgi:hypothetical protein
VPEVANLPTSLTGLLTTEARLGQGSRILQYSPLLVPGLLQATLYARAVATTATVQRSGDELETFVQLRLARGQRVLVDGVECVFLLDESILRRRVGTSTVMAEQLDHLVAIANRGNVTIRIIPIMAGVFPGILDSYQIIKPADGPASVYLENSVQSRYESEREIVERYETFFEQARQKALTPEASIDLLVQLRGQFSDALASIM